MGNTPGDPLHISPIRNRVRGLRTEAPPSKVRVYKANPDGSKGALIRIEPPFGNTKKKRV